jgi:anti-sigma B factor antagonist
LVILSVTEALMTLDSSFLGGRLIIHVQATRIDAASAIDFKEELRGLTDGGNGPVVLDLAEVGFLDSSGLGAVVAVRKFLGPERPLELARLTPPVEKVLRLTRMDTIFVIHADLPGGGAADRQNAM